MFPTVNDEAKATVAALTKRAGVVYGDYPVDRARVCGDERIASEQLRVAIG